jgi:hypothetical protein
MAEKLSFGVSSSTSARLLAIASWAILSTERVPVKHAYFPIPGSI